MLPRPKIRQHWLYVEMQTRSIAITRRIAASYGDLLGFVYVCGYPKSGTTWISRMVADCLDLPFPREYALPLAFRCVLHHHWSPRAPFEHALYVVRDGRDVMTSEYMSLMFGMAVARRERIARFGRLSWSERMLLQRLGRDARLARRMDRLFGRGFDPADVARHLPVFLEANLTRPLSEVVSAPWQEHVRLWRQAGQRATFIRYEQMLQDGPAALGEAIAAHTGRSVDAERLREVVEHYSFRRMTGREPGVEDRTRFERKGITGDWRNSFTRDAAQVFAHYAGKMLIELGYEPDEAWVSRLDG